MKAAERVIASDERFEHLAPAEELIQEFAEDCATDRKTDHVEVFMERPGREAIDQTEFPLGRFLRWLPLCNSIPGADARCNSDDEEALGAHADCCSARSINFRQCSAVSRSDSRICPRLCRSACNSSAMESAAKTATLTESTAPVPRRPGACARPHTWPTAGDSRDRALRRRCKTDREFCRLSCLRASRRKERLGWGGAIVRQRDGPSKRPDQAVSKLDDGSRRK